MISYEGKSYKTDQIVEATNKLTRNQIFRCLWAVSDPEIQKSCFLARVCETVPPLKCQYLKTIGIQQNGPTCGLTAISMMFNGKPTTDQLLETAKNLEYTKNGEMFSAYNLYKLTEQSVILSDLNAKQYECQFYEGRLDCEKVKKCLYNGSCLLVPYDPDFNHAPCLKNGNKAHWALIIGYLITVENEFYVIARHGKARNLGVWSLKALSESNANLNEFEQPAKYPNLEFLTPPGGIGGILGLKERAIIVQGLPNEVMVLK